jgi:hypothetical protein
MRKVALFAALILAVGLAGALPAAARSTAAHPVQQHVNAKGGLDCNGFSPLQKTFRFLDCTEIAANDDEGFLDNGHYIGHDEPDLGFYSNRHGSGNSMTYRLVLPRDPKTPPSATPGGTTHMFQLTPAIWFGLTMCDNESYPEGTKVCKPDSNSNIQVLLRGIENADGGVIGGADIGGVERPRRDVSRRGLVGEVACVVGRVPGQSSTSVTAARAAVSSTRDLLAAKAATRACRARLLTARG